MNVIIDYQAGNLYNLKNALDFLGVPAKIVSDAASVSQAERILLPGVGAFGPAMENLRRAGLVEVIRERVAAGVPFLGICLGMQLIFREGFENGHYEGLGLISGQVVRFTHTLKIPQIGWNQVQQQRPHDPLFAGIADKSYFYFVHSYHGIPDSPEASLGVTDYGGAFTSIVRARNVYGVQFHPEKSQAAGLQLLKNFCAFEKQT